VCAFRRRRSSGLVYLDYRSHRRRRSDYLPRRPPRTTVFIIVIIVNSLLFTSFPTTVFRRLFCFLFFLVFIIYARYHSGENIVVLITETTKIVKNRNPVFSRLYRLHDFHCSICVFFSTVSSCSQITNETLAL